MVMGLLGHSSFEKKSLLIKNYLTNRWHKSRINASFSLWKELLQCVPHGSVLGPLLFNIYFNDLFPLLRDTDASNYADDTALYACDMDFETAETSRA